jgi:hypothetical protein
VCVADDDCLGLAEVRIQSISVPKEGPPSAHVEEKLVMVSLD